MTSHDDAIGARLARLERELADTTEEVRRLRRRGSVVRLLSTAALVAAAISVSGRSPMAQTASRVQAPFEVLDAAGKTIVRIDPVANGAATVMIGAAESGGVRIGVGASGSGFVVVRRANGVTGASIGEHIGNPMGVQVFDTSGDKSEPVARLFPGGSGKGELSLGVSSSGGARMGVGSSGAGYLVVRRADALNGLSLGQHMGQPMGVQVFGASGDTGEPLARLGSHPSGAGRLVVRGEGRTVATLGPSQLGQLGLTIGTNDKAPGATFGLLSDGTGQAVLTDEGGGEVVVGGYKTSPVGMRLFDSTGGERVTIAAGEKGLFGVTVSGTGKNPVARISEAAIGGGFVSTYNTAGTIGAIVSGTGQIHVANSAGQTLATMVAEKNQGAFSIRSASGTTIARLGEGIAGGLFQLADLAGNAMVEAGIHPNGVGLVRTFPNGSSAANVAGMPGTFLLGRQVK